MSGKIFELIVTQDYILFSIIYKYSITVVIYNFLIHLITHCIKWDIYLNDELYMNRNEDCVFWDFLQDYKSLKREFYWKVLCLKICKYLCLRCFFLIQSILVYVPSVMDKNNQYLKLYRLNIY